MARRGKVKRPHTVDGDGNALGEDIAVGADEGRDLAELVVLQVLGSRLLGVGVDNLETDIVGLGNSQDTRRAGVGLKQAAVSQMAG